MYISFLTYNLSAKLHPVQIFHRRNRSIPASDQVTATILQCRQTDVAFLVNSFTVLYVIVEPTTQKC